MSEVSNSSVNITVDMKKYRIRIFKSCLHKMGNPKYIQLLVNPEEMVVALRSVEKESAGDQTHKVSQSRMESDNSVEIHSRFFIEKLCEVVGGLEPGHSYRLNGTILKTEKIGVFSLKTIKKITK